MIGANAWVILGLLVQTAEDFGLNAMQTEKRFARSANGVPKTKRMLTARKCGRSADNG